MFDPYEQWLGIPGDQRPITYYQLLGISPRENDPEAIEEAARRQAAKLRKHQEGPQAQACARLLKEINQAKAVLLNPAKRKEYEARPRKASPETEPAEEEELVEETPPPSAAREKKQEAPGKLSKKKRKRREDDG